MRLCFYWTADLILAKTGLTNCVCVCFFSVSNNGITMEGVFTLADALCSHSNLTQIHIRYSLFYIFRFMILLELQQSEHFFQECGSLSELQQLTNVNAKQLIMSVYKR